MSNVVLSDTNVAMRRVDWEDTVGGLGLPKVLTASQSVVSNIIQPQAPMSLQARLIASLVNGAAHVYVCVHNGTPVWTPSATCIVLDITDADPAANGTHTSHALTINTTMANPMVSVKIADDGSGSTFSEGVLQLSGMWESEDEGYPNQGGYHEARRGFNGLPVDGGNNYVPYSDVLS